MHALHASAHILQTGLWSACSMHSSMHIWHIAMQASSIATMTAGVMPCMRIIDRIMVLHMSAQFMHAGAQSIICVEHTVQACSHAAHASIQACIIAMSIAGMPSIDIMSADMASIIFMSISHHFPVGASLTVGPACTIAATVPRTRRRRQAPLGSTG